MGVKIEPTSKIKAKLGIDPNGPVQWFFANTCYKHMDKYVPMDKGDLATEVSVRPNRITYQMPYALYQYNGVSKSGKPLNYSTDKHPHATSHWDKKMVSAEFDDVIREVQKFINKR